MENNKERHLEEVDHGYVRYANVWEDPNLLIEGLYPIENKRVLSICSAGDNAFALLTENPELVVAIDLNDVQLFLTELKMVAIKNMTQEEYVAFSGFGRSQNRMNAYKKIEQELTEDCRKYWNQNTDVIENGICKDGKFEKYLRSFAVKLLPFIHTKRRIKSLFTKKTEEDQQVFYDKKWNSIRWKLMFRLFFSKQIMGIFGRDKAFLAQVKVNVGKTIMEKAGLHLSTVYAQTNPMLYYCLHGNFGPYLPFYMQKAQYNKVKENLPKMKLEYGYAQDAAAKYGKFDRFNLSNIFEYMTDEVFEITAKELVKSANPKSRFAYWNLMVKKEMSSIIEEVQRVPDVLNWAERDQGFFYMQYVVEEGGK